MKETAGVLGVLEEGEMVAEKDLQEEAPLGRLRIRDLECQHLECQSGIPLHDISIL